MTADFDIKRNISIGANNTAITYLHSVLAEHGGRVNKRRKPHIGNALYFFYDSVSYLGTSDSANIVRIRIFNRRGSRSDDPVPVDKLALYLNIIVNKSENIPFGIDGVNSLSRSYTLTSETARADNYKIFHKEHSFRDEIIRDMVVDLFTALAWASAVCADVGGDKD